MPKSSLASSFWRMTRERGRGGEREGEGERERLRTARDKMKILFLCDVSNGRSFEMRCDVACEWLRRRPISGCVVIYGDL